MSGKVFPTTTASRHAAAHPSYLLLVELDGGHLEAVLRALSTRDYRVAVLGDPEEFGGAVTYAAPDLIIGLVGAEWDAALPLCAELQALGHADGIPFLVVGSAGIADAAAAQLLGAGADDLMEDAATKPMELRERVHKQLAQRASREALRHVLVERETLRHEARTDPLTGVWNRRTFEAALDRSVLGRQRFGLLFVDVDHFKRINDEVGHDAGDAVLVHLAATLTTLVRPEDTVARLGGEEFVVLLAGATGDGAMAAAERIRTRLAEPHPVEGVPSVTVSVGVATLELGDETGGDELLRRADAALYAAKRGGRDQVVRYHADLPVTKESARKKSGTHRVPVQGPTEDPPWAVPAARKTCAS